MWSISCKKTKKAQLRTPIGNITTYDELKITFQESNADTDNTLPNISDAALTQSLVALNCYKCSPVQNCTCLSIYVYMLYIINVSL